MKFLRQRTIDELKLFGYSGMTIKNYVEAISAFSKYHGKSPDTLNEEDVKVFLIYSQKCGLAPSSMRIRRCGILFFFNHVLKRDMDVSKVPSMKQERRLPNILSTSEIERIFSVVTDLKEKTILMTFYATGMRLEELRLFQLKNIDSSRMTLKFMGKGKRERYVPLSIVLLKQLREYYKKYKPVDTFFINKFRAPFHRRSIQTIFEDSKKLAGIRKSGGVHMIRHSFATHLFESGVSIHLIQKLLGHHRISTTEKYVHVATHTITSVQSPLDLLDFGAHMEKAQ